MKRLIAIPLLFLYLTAVSGAMIQIHYCGSKVASWNINKHTQACCCGPENQETTPVVKEKKCCSSKTINLTLKESQSHVSKISGFLAALALADTRPVIFLPETDLYLPAARAVVYRGNAPPGPWQNIPLYKLHSSFTYYS